MFGEISMLPMSILNTAFGSVMDVVCLYCTGLKFTVSAEHDTVMSYSGELFIS